MSSDIHQKHRFLHSFDLRPHLRFETQHSTEEVILALRAHPITQIFWIINSLILLVVIFFLNFVYPIFFDFIQLLFINVFGLAVVFAYIWFNFLGWFFNVGIITKERILDIDFHSVIYKEVTAAFLNKVEDVTVKSAGFFSSIFNYGNVFIQTAGSETNIEFIDVPNPTEASRIINDLLKK